MRGSQVRILYGPPECQGVKTWLGFQYRFAVINIDQFRKFISAANRAHQQLCVWFNMNNHFAVHQTRWNEHNGPPSMFDPKSFTRANGCKYKNFWSVTNASVQHGWIMGSARIFDPAYHPRDKEKARPRISLDLILQSLGDRALATTIEAELTQHSPVVQSVRTHRDNVLAHNDASFSAVQIEAGVEALFEWLEDVIERIKASEPHLSSCGNIQTEYNEQLSKCGVDEVFETLLLGEKAEGSI